MLPYNRLLVALKSLGYNFRETQSVLNNYKFPTLTEDQFVNLNAEDVDDWVKDLIEAWEDKDSYKVVFYKLLNNARLRYKIIPLITANPNISELAKAMAENGYKEIKEDSLELFKKWFWDVDEVKEKDWDYIFTNNRFPKIILEKIQNALYGSEMNAYFENGIFPKTNPDSFLNGVISVAYQKMRDMMSDPMKRNRITYNEATKQAMKAIEVLTNREKSGSSEVDPNDIIGILEGEIKFKNMNNFDNFNELKEGDE